MVNPEGKSQTEDDDDDIHLLKMCDGYGGLLYIQSVVNVEVNVDHSQQHHGRHHGFQPAASFSISCLLIHWLNKWTF